METSLIELTSGDDDICIENDRDVTRDTVKFSYVRMNGIYGISIFRSNVFNDLMVSTFMA